MGEFPSPLNATINPETPDHKSFPQSFTITLEDVFRTVSSIYDGVFCEIVDGSKLLLIFLKNSIMDIWQSPTYIHDFLAFLLKKKCE